MRSLENAKVGDELVVTSSRLGGRDLLRLVKVARVLQRSIEDEDGVKWNKERGTRVGNSDSWHPPRAYIASDDDRQQIRDQQALERAEGLVRRLTAVKLTSPRAAALIIGALDEGFFTALKVASEGS